MYIVCIGCTEIQNLKHTYYYFQSDLQNENLTVNRVIQLKAVELGHFGSTKT